ncbi:Abscisic acid receptor pyl4 [Ranunculus cassubicifolius]
MPSQPLKSSLQLQRVTTPTKQKLIQSCGVPLPEAVARQHAHSVGPNQCCSTLTQTILAPESTVWSVVRRFDKPEAYKHFVKSCKLVFGNGGEVGSLREVHVVSGLPAATSTERLEILDEERHILSFSVIGGDHRLENYRSYTTLHPIPMANGYGTLVVESYVVDIPQGNTSEDTRVFTDTIVRCNLQSLASICTTPTTTTTTTTTTT